MKMIKTIFAIFTIFIFNDIGAQENNIKFESYSTKEGLSQSSVTAIFQDDEGFLWFGTYGGLNRFDGYNFKRFQFDMNNPSGISHNHVRSICQDTTGILWVATVGGLNRFFTHTEEFIHFLHDPDDTNSLADDEVYKVYKDIDGDIWIGTFGNGLDKLERIEGYYSNERDVKYRFVHHKPVKDKNSISNDRISSIDETPDGSLWIGSFGLNKFNKEMNSFKVYWHNPDHSNSLSSNYVSALCVDKEGYVWVGTWGGGLNRLNPENDVITRFLHDPYDEYTISHDIIMSLYCDNEGNVWVGTWGGGLNKVIFPDKTKQEEIKNHDNKGSKFIRYQSDVNIQSSISGNSIYSIFEDRTGIMWVGTDWAGVNKFEKGNARFKHIYTQKNTSNSLNNNIIHALLFDKNRDLWIATQEGLNVYNQATKTYRLFKHNPEDPATLSNNHIRSLLESKDGTIWVGTIQGLNKYIPQTGRFKRYFIDPFNPGNTNNLSLYESSNGLIWIGNYSGGLYKFDPNTETFIVYKHDPENNKSISNNEIWDIIEDKNGILWVGTAKGGLCKFDQKSEIFTSFQNNPDDSSSISSNHVISLYIDHEDNLWAGTALGLNKLVYNRNGNVSFVRYTEKDGLSAQTINGIVEDFNNQFWISTSQGLNRFDPVKNVFTRYNIEDGLQDNEFSINAIIRDDVSGEILAGGINGYNVFDPQKIDGKGFTPEVKIIELRLFNKPVRVREKIHDRIILEKTLSALNKIELSYKEYVISFEYSALHYQSSKGNQYAFMLEGFDKDWNYVGNQRIATYTNLKPGNYTFRVKAANMDNIWDETGDSLDVYIKPPFWKTWWFRLVVIILFIILLLLIYFNRVSQIKKRNLYLEKIIKERTGEIEKQNIVLNDLNVTKDKFFSIIAHDLKNPFNTLLGFTELLKRNFDQYDKEKMLQIIGIIRSSSRKIFNLLENLLQWSRSQTGTLQFSLKEVNVAGILIDNINLISQNAKEKNIKLDLEIENENMSLNADDNLLNTVIRNLLSNALKFTPENGKVLVKVIENEDNVQFEISDNGIGIKKEDLDKLFRIDIQYTTIGTKNEKGTGLGLILCKEFIEKHNGKIWVESELKKGTTFKFTIPKIF